MRLMLSTSNGQWRVLAHGSPLCADTTEDRARAVFVREADRATHRRQPAELSFWDGDKGEGHTLTAADVDAMRGGQQ